MPSSANKPTDNTHFAMPTVRIIAHKLTTQHKTLSLAESCTGGLIAKTLTDIPGSSAFFIVGFITYANEAKVKFLKIPIGLLKKYGAVSAPVAKAMAQGIRQTSRTDFSIAVTGIAGPAGGTRQKPVGLIFIAVSSANKVISRRFVFNGTRQRIRKQAAQTALKMLLQLIG